jgi:hypothetical protein
VSSVEPSSTTIISVSSPASFVKRPMSSSVAAKTAAAFLAGMVTERTEAGSGAGLETILHVAGEKERHGIDGKRGLLVSDRRQ